MNWEAGGGGVGSSSARTKRRTACTHCGLLVHVNGAAASRGLFSLSLLLPPSQRRASCMATYSCRSVCSLYARSQRTGAAGSLAGSQPVSEMVEAEWAAAPLRWTPSRTSWRVMQATKGKRPGSCQVTVHMHSPRSSQSAASAQWPLSTFPCASSRSCGCSSTATSSPFSHSSWSRSSLRTDSSANWRYGSSRRRWRIVSGTSQEQSNHPLFVGVGVFSRGGLAGIVFLSGWAL
ncbi:hypothetical protein ABW21_db0206547 [Orbilia brochopaga]|nr:hypothetical protein ABW21_db0206547 [Drechslerella brochopaga]